MRATAGLALPAGSGGGQAGGASFNLSLNGRNLNLYTEEGANGFLTYHHENRDPSDRVRPSFLAGILDNAIEMRATLNNNNSSPSVSNANANNRNERRRQQRQHQQQPQQQRRQLMDQCSMAYIMFGAVADCCSHEQFERCISDQDLDGWLNHFVTILTDLTNNPNWIRTGVLEKHDKQLFDSLITLAKHTKFVKLALQEPYNLVGVIANFIAAVRKENSPNMLPCPDVTDTLLAITKNVKLNLAYADWPKEKVFKKLESSGLLAQFLRCITQPSSPSSPIPVEQCGYLLVLDDLLKCPILVQKKLCAGQPTGDLLNRLLLFQDGYGGRRHPEVTRRLKNIRTLAALSSNTAQLCTTTATAPADDNGDAGTSSPILARSCRHCSKASIDFEFQRALLMCSRCKDTYYCSKECQRADWKLHKPSCIAAAADSDRNFKEQPALQQLLMSFVTENYYQIMIKLVEAMDQYQLPHFEMLLEVDFYASSDDGNNRREAPALKTPPEFLVVPTKNYVKTSSGGRDDAPDWFYKGTEVYERNVSKWRLGLEDQYNRMANTPDQLLVIVRYSTGDPGVYRLLMHSKPGGGPTMFSDEAMDAFQRAVKRGDDSRLERVYTPEHAAAIKRQRDYDRFRSV